MNFEEVLLLSIVGFILWPYFFDKFNGSAVTFLMVILRGLTILICHILRTRQFLH
ncbi:hypothetical protein ACE6H2_007400 [Prunus campanulata]